jgi:hypothetical protein
MVKSCSDDVTFVLHINLHSQLIPYAIHSSITDELVLYADGITDDDTDGDRSCRLDQTIVKRQAQLQCKPSSQPVLSSFEKQQQGHLLKVQEVMLHQQQRAQLALQRTQGSVLMAWK